ncbi:hypothetical protein D3C84_1192140 [compost metagenome]
MGVRVPPVALVRLFVRVDASLGLAQLRPGGASNSGVEVAAVRHELPQRAGEVRVALFQVGAVFHGQREQVGLQIGAFGPDHFPASQIGP